MTKTSIRFLSFFLSTLAVAWGVASTFAQTPAVQLPIQKEGTKPPSIISTEEFSELSNTVLADSPSSPAPESPNLQLTPDHSTNLEESEHSDHHEPHGAELLGVLPGKTLMTDLESSPVWNKPIGKEVLEGYLVQTYKLPDLPEMPFIQILGRNNVVEGIVVHLLEPREEQDARLAFEDAVKNLRPITIADGDGTFREIFPEKGLVFVLEASENPSVPSNRVVQIVAETVKPEYYIIRAERDLKKSLGNAKSDAEHALLHDSNYSPAYWLLAKISLSSEQYEEAKKYCVRAVKLDDSIPQYHLTLVEILIKLEEWENAARYLDAIQPLCQENALLKGKWSLLSGTVSRETETLENQSPNYETAIQSHETALNSGKSLFKDSSSDVQIAGKLLALEASLALILDISRQESENGQFLTVSQRITNASVMADELYKQGASNAEPLFDVCRTAVSVGLDFPEIREIDNYIRSLEKTSQTLLDETQDETTRAAIQWKTARAYFDALRIYQAQENLESATSVGTKAVELLQECLNRRPERDRVELGKIYYYLGAVALEKNDSKSAFDWFDQANAVFETIAASLGENGADVGTMMINASRLYWKSGKKDRALAITQTAVKIIEQNVEAGFSERSELFVPYSNLSTMYQGLQKPEEAQKYAALAEQAQAEQAQEK